MRCVSGRQAVLEIYTLCLSLVLLTLLLLLLLKPFINFENAAVTPLLRSTVTEYRLRRDQNRYAFKREPLDYS